MLFQSAGFLFIFLPLFLLFIFLVPKGIARSLALAAFSYLFYSGNEPFFCLILLVSSSTDYFVALGINHAKRHISRKIFLSISVVINLGLLAFFKYGGWLIPGLSPYLQQLGIPIPDDNYFKGYILPAGISFYTFQSLSYSIDVYRGQIKPEKNFLGFCNYVAYLPQLIAGPIERFGHLYPQIKQVNEGGIKSYWPVGLDRISLGLIQKLLIADGCGLIVDRVVEVVERYDFVSAWVVSIGFGMQIYYDFAAYTNIAIGISLVLGIRLRENFNSPYQATNIRDFWRRWHMTLSNWFRDYLYIPLGGSREGNFRSVINIILTFLLVGLWHGAGWNFVFWGGIHGFLLAGYHLKQVLFPRLKMNFYAGIFLTFLCVHMAWIPFRVEDITVIINIWAAMLGMEILNYGWISGADLLFLSIVVFFTLILPNASKRSPGNSGWCESACLLMIAVFAIFSTPELNKFIYFQF